MDEKIKFILSEEKRKNQRNSLKFTSKYKAPKNFARYDSAVFYMQNKKIIGLKESFAIKNLKLDAPNNNLSPIKKLKSHHIKSKILLSSLQKTKKQSIKSQTGQIDLILNQINPNNILLNNKFLKLFNKKICKEIQDMKEQNKANIKSFSFPYNKLNKSVLVNGVDKKFKAIKPKALKLEKNKNISVYNYILEKNNNVFMDKIPFNTLKHYKRKLFNRGKNFKRKNIVKGEYSLKMKSNPDFSDSFSIYHQSDNNLPLKYEMIELENKKNYFADKLYKNIEYDNLSSLRDMNNSEKNDFHFIMKHPFSNDSFCGSYMNRTIHNNSYINDLSERYKNCDNPLNDKEFIKKLHNLIINPNTNKIRNSKLLSMYKNFPKGTFYGELSKNKEISKVDNELEKLENTKYNKFVIKLKDSLNRAKKMQNYLDELLIINKKSI